MYDSLVISEYLSQLDPQTIINPGTKQEKTIHFELNYHTPSEIQIANDHFDSLINLDLYETTKDTSNPKIIFKDPFYKLSEEEAVWIENERILCKWDCNYFQDGYYKILDSEGNYIQFAPLVPQLVNRRIRARLQRARRAIRKWTVKARQQGETSDSEGVILHRVAFFDDVKALISSKDSNSTEKMSAMFTGGMSKLPYWNRPEIKRYSAGEDYEYKNGSLLDLGWGTQDSLGRGRTPLVAHCSEIPFYKYPEKALEEALFNAKHESIWEMLLMEGTAEKRDDYYHLKTKEIIEGMEAHLTSFIFCFHPWCARRDLFPTEAWMTARSEAFYSWKPSIETLNHARKLENWVGNNEDYREVYKEVNGEPFKLDREQLFYYETEKNAAKKRNALQAFLKEKPSDPEEAFQSAGQSIYPIETIIVLSDNAQADTPEVYKLRGDPNEINPEFFPSVEEIKPNGKVIQIRSRWNLSIPASDFEMVQVNFNGWDSFDYVNKILIWEHARMGCRYGMAADTSDGLGRNISDDAVFEVIKDGTAQYKDKQVAEWASPEVPHNQLWPFGLALGTLYSPEEQLLFAPETNKGTELLTDMIRRGWANIYKPIDPTKPSQDRSKIIKLGWFTSPAARRDAINHLNSFIKGNWFDIKSMELIKELKDLVIKRTVSSVVGNINEKLLGKKDNRFMAIAIALYILHIDSIVGYQKAAWEERTRQENAQVYIKTFSGFEYEKDDAPVTYMDQEELEEGDEEFVTIDEGY